GLTDLPVITAFEINASCANTSAGGLEFGATPEGLRDLVRRCRAVATRPIAVKLSPVLPDIAGMARVAEQEGADAVTLVNTIPGALDGRLGNGTGGVSGPALLAIGLPGLRWAKICPRLHVREGPALVREFTARGVRVFLDLKWHDIPSVVAGAVDAARSQGIAMATVHTLGGPAVLAAARAAAGDMA